jgi:hypothetical protein
MTLCLLLLLTQYHGCLKLNDHLPAPEELRLNDLIDDNPLRILCGLIVRHESEDEADGVFRDNVTLGARFAALFFLFSKRHPGVGRVS